MNFIIDKNINQVSKNINKTLILIFFLIPILYVLGSFFANLVTIIFVIYFFYLTNKKLVFFSKEEYFFFIFLLFFFIINSIFSSDKVYTLTKSFAFLRFIFFSISIIFILKFFTNKNKKKYIIFYNLCILFFSLDTIIQFLFGVDLFGNKINFYGRLSGPFGDEYIVGIYLFTFGFLGYALLKKNFQDKPIIDLFYLTFLPIIIFITGERNAFLTTILFLILLFLINSNLRKYVFLSLIIIFLSSYFITQINQPLKDRYTFNIITMSTSLDNKNENSIDVDNSNTNNIKKNIYEKINRIQYSPWAAHVRASIKIFQKNKLIGSGFRTFRYECLLIKNNNLNEWNNKENVICTTHPHNFYFELLSDTGLIGLILFLSSIFLIIFNFFKKKLYLYVHSSIIMSLFLAYIFPFKPHGSFFSTNSTFFFWYILGFLIWTIFNNKKSNR